MTSLSPPGQEFEKRIATAVDTAHYVLVLISPNRNTCFWAGWGGSLVMIDQDAHIVASYAMNKMYPTLIGDTRSFETNAAAYQDLG